MSSKAVRDSLKTYLTTNLPTEKIIDLSDKYETMEDMITSEGLTRSSKWVGLQYIGATEIPVVLNIDTNAGGYREEGSLFIHIVDIASMGVGSAILTRAEAIRTLLRGKRIGNIVIDSVQPPSFESEVNLDLEAGYMSASIIVNYTYDLNL